MKILVFVVLTFVLFASTVNGQVTAPPTTQPSPNALDPIIPTFNLGGDTRLTIFGHSQATYIEDRHNKVKDNSLRDDVFGRDEWQWSSTRIKAMLATPQIRFFGEIEAMDLDNPDANWLRRAETTLVINPDWQITAGRLFLAAGCFTPGPQFLETVVSPRYPFASYAYGIQTFGKLGDGWSILADVSGTSGISFNSSESFDRLETSGRLEKQFAKNVFVAGTWQVSEDFTSLGLDASYYLASNFRIRGGAYTRRMDAGSEIGGYIFAGYDIIKDLELHTQFDALNGEIMKDGTTWTNGVRIRFFNNRVAFTLDHETVLVGSQANRLLARVQFQF